MRVSPTPKEIRELRLRAGLTQAQAAEIAGLSDGRTWRAYELGEHKIRPLAWEVVKQKMEVKCQANRKTC